MDSGEARVAMFCKDSPHHAHEGFAEAIDADVVSYSGLSAPLSGTLVGTKFLLTLSNNPRLRIAIRLAGLLCVSKHRQTFLM